MSRAFHMFNDVDIDSPSGCCEAMESTIAVQKWD